MKAFLNFSILFLLLSLPGLSFAVAGYQPSVTVSKGSTSTTLRAVISKIGFAPYDLLAKVYPSVSTGLKLGASATGAAASVLYQNSAAVVSRAYVPLASGANIALDFVANVPKGNLAAAALNIAKNPYLAAALIAAPVLYDWITSAGLSKDAQGNLLGVPASTKDRTYTYSFNGFSCSGYTDIQAGLSCIIASYISTSGCTNNCPSIGASFIDNVTISSFQWHLRPGTSNGNGSISASSTCSTGYTYNSSTQTCNRIDPAPVPAPITDADALQQLKEAKISSPANALQDVVDLGETPDSDYPFGSSPASTPLGSKTTVNPDGTKQTTTSTLNSTCSGDTCTFTQSNSIQNLTAAGAVTNTTTTTEAPTISTSSGTSPAVETPVSSTPFDDSGIIAAINANTASAHDDALAAPEQIAHSILDESPATLPIPPAITPDTDAYFPFLDTVNPYNWDINGFLPSLPMGACTYEIHQSIFGKAFDFAPCAKLEPLRNVLSWVFSVLTLWTCFTVIFRSSF